MTLITRDAIGIDNARAKMTYTFDDADSPTSPKVTEIRVINQSHSGHTLHVQLVEKTTGVDLAIGPFSHPPFQGSDLVLDRLQIVALLGDLRMVQSVSARNGSTGWAFPHHYRHWIT